MNTCFQCGRPIQPDTRHLRRKVKTGEWMRRRYGSGKPTSRNVHFGLRIVCARCAHSIDKRREREELFLNIQLAAALAVLVIVVLYLFVRQSL